MFYISVADSEEKTKRTLVLFFDLNWGQID